MNTPAGQRATQRPVDSQPDAVMRVFERDCEGVFRWPGLTARIWAIALSTPRYLASLLGVLPPNSAVGWPRRLSGCDARDPPPTARLTSKGRANPASWSRIVIFFSVGSTRCQT